MAQQASAPGAREDRSKRESFTLADSHRELLELVEGYYERTGDPGVKGHIERAKRVAR